jgi:hypothetical protein
LGTLSMQHALGNVGLTTIIGLVNQMETEGNPIQGMGVEIYEEDTETSQPPFARVWAALALTEATGPPWPLAVSGGTRGRCQPG